MSYRVVRLLNYILRAFSEILELCGNFPVFPLFVPLPRHVVVYIYFFLLRYSFLLFSMPRIIFLVYSAVNWLLPRKVFLLQGNLFDALVSRQRFDYFRRFVLPSRFYFCRVKFLLCVALSVLELYFRAPILYRWLILLCFFYCRVAFFAWGFSTPFFFLPRKVFNICRALNTVVFCCVTYVAA